MVSKINTKHNMEIWFFIEIFCETLYPEQYTMEIGELKSNWKTIFQLPKKFQKNFLLDSSFLSKEFDQRCLTISIN